MSQIPLKMEALAKRFGGVEALKSFSLEMLPNHIHAIIGPNGAGKSTLARMIGGDITADSGKIWIFGREITKLPVAARARLGIGRSFQLTTLFDAMTVVENLKVALLAARSERLGVWKRYDRDEHLHNEANQLLQRFGLQPIAQQRAQSLAHGQKRALEMALALAARPQILILDEPLAGTASQEAQHISTIIGQLRNDASILLIEHDMEAVFKLADQITVMVDGQIIATGVPNEIRQDAGVIEAYLGSSNALT